jgi:hypothetical protein
VTTEYTDRLIVRLCYDYVSAARDMRHSIRCGRRKEFMKEV